MNRLWLTTLPSWLGSLAILLAVMPAWAEDFTYLPDPLPDKPLVVRATTTSAGTLILSKEANGKGLKFSIRKAGELILIRERDIADDLITPAAGRWTAYLDGEFLKADGDVPAPRTHKEPYESPAHCPLLGVTGMSLNDLTIQENTEPRFGDDFMRDNEKGELGGEWIVDSGTFSIAHEAQAKLAASPFHAVGRGSKGPCSAHAGRWYWNNYIVAASFEYRGGTIGIDALRYKNGYVRFTAGPDGLAIRITNPLTGGQEYLYKDPQVLTPGWHQLSLDTDVLGGVSACIDFVPFMHTGTRLPCGGIGAFVDGDDTRIDDVVVLPLKHINPWETLEEWWGSAPIVQTAFQKDAEMQLWSRRIGIFTFDQQAKAVRPQISLWTPFTVAFDAPKMNGDVALQDAGIPVKLVRSEKGLSLNDKEVPAGKGACAFTIDAGLAKLSVDGTVIEHHLLGDGWDPVDLKITGSLASSLLNSINVSGPNIRQFTFYRAPVLFEPLAGTWNESSLWACSPQYSWFQGRAGEKTKDRVAIARYKEHLSGDFYIRAVIAIPMEGDQTPYYEFPINFGVSLTPEKGESVTCLFGLCDVKSLLAQGDKVLGENSDDVNPFVRSMFSLIKHYIHTSWYDLEIIRRGDKITMQRDGRKLIETEIKGLPSTLETSFVTGDNAVVISRLEIAADSLRAPEKLGDTKVSADAIRQKYMALLYKDYPGLAKAHALLAERADKAEAPAAPLNLPFDEAANKAFQQATGMKYMRWMCGNKEQIPNGFSGYDGVELFQSPADGGSPWLIVVNRHVGGEMLLPLTRQPFDLRDYPTLELEYKIPQKTKPGLMMIVNGRFVETTLVADREDFGSNFRNDGQPGKGRIDLVNIARSRGINPPYTCEMLAFNDPYWQSHTRGDWYAIRNVMLIPKLVRKELPAGVESKDKRIVTIGDLTLLADVQITGQDTPSAQSIAEKKIPFSLTESSVHLTFQSAPQTASLEAGEDWGEVGIRGGMLLYPREVSGVKCLSIDAAHFNEWERYTFLKRNAFNVDELPLLRFRYKLRQGAQGWLGARVGHEVLAIFDSHNHRGQEVQKRTMFAADGQWHTMVVDLRQVLKEYLFADDMGKRIVEQVFTNTPWWQRDTDRRIMYLDEVSLYTERPEKLTVKVDVPSDANSFGGLSFSVDNNEKGAAPAQVMAKGSEFSLDKPADAGKFLHIKAFDGLSNAGTDVTVRLFP